MENYAGEVFLKNVVYQNLNFKYQMSNIKMSKMPL